MKTVYLLTALLLLSGTLIFAAGNSGHHSSIQGCLSSSAGSYTLTDPSGKTYQLEGETAKLSDYVGHEVQLAGKESSSSGTTGSGSSSDLALFPATSSQSLKFNVSKVKKISDTCTTTTTKK